MTLAAGTRFGPYEILRPLGAGGMGEVYRAKDTRLGREVAVKILPEHLSANAEARERFEREAKAISSLNHPNICTLYDVGEREGIGYLVMELLEGETLASRLERGPLKVEEALRIAVQATDALDKAHRKGIIHRDLKPGNLMLTKAGVKILDFGVAKLREESASPSAAGTAGGILPTMAPTRTTPLTSSGAVLGTMQYMAPEQLEGKPLDHRVDLFSFGAVLYEMVTGKRAFEGASQASVIAAILEREPRPVAELVPASPAALNRVIRRCLAKDPEERWQSALDLTSELEWISGGTSAAVGLAPAAPLPARRRLPAWLAWGGVLLGATAMLGLGWILRRPAPVPVMRTSIVMPRGTTLDTDNASIALSPDGTRLAYAAREKGGPLKLWVRPMDSLTAQALAGTEGATYPFWSPDGSQLGFFADGKLKKVQASGGAAQSICPAEDGRGASWGAGDVIVFAPRPYGALFQVPASGGTPSPLTTAKGEALTHRNPRFLPGGTKLLFFSGTNARSPENGVYRIDLATKKVDLVIHADSEGIYVEPGYLVFVREGNLLAQRIDLSSMRTSGDAMPIAENVQFNTFRFTGTYTLSPTGLMVYRSGAIQGEDRLTWYDLDGKRLGTLGEPAIFWLSMRISPDDRKALAAVRHPDGGSDLWMYDLVSGIGSRFTLGETNGLQPIWSPDGRQVVYSDGSDSIYVKAADGASSPRKLYTTPGRSILPQDWTRDGSRILFSSQSSRTGFDLLSLPVAGEAKPTPVVVTPAREGNASFSPDGRWLAYRSDESGRSELYVASFPGPGGKWQISTGGAQAGGWLGSGKEIWYTNLEGKYFAVSVAASGAGIEVGTPRPLFGDQDLSVISGTFTHDGKRFLGAVPVAGDTGPVLTVVSRWASELKKK